MTEVYIDGYKLDVPPGVIRQTFQNNRLGTLSDRQLNFTNKWDLPLTGSNERFFKHLREINSQSSQAYRILPCVLIEGGLEVVNGTARVETHNNRRVKISVQSGNNGLFEKINSLSIRDLDWSALNHTIASWSDITSTFDGSGDYIYALCQQTDLVNRQGYAEYWLPSVYEHAIISMIFSQAGFSISGAIFSDPDYLAKVINPVTFDEEEPNLLVRDFSKFMPDILQTEFLREILMRYGLMFERTAESEYTFKTFKEILRNNDPFDDWTERLVEVEDIDPVMGDYARKNYLRYRSREGYNGSADGFFGLDTEYLPQQRTLFTSKYAAVYQVDSFDALRFPIFEFEDNGTDFSIAEIEPSISEIENITKGGAFTSDALGPGGNYPDPVPVLRFNNLNYSKYTLESYQEIRQMANKAKVVQARMYFRPLDIYNLDFFKLKWIESLASFFYLNKISSWEKGKECQVELVRVPPNIFSGAEVSNTAPVVQLDADPLEFDQDSQMDFLTTVTDAENNIERWELNTGQGLPLSGFGIPPATIPFTYTTPGTYTAVLTVWDFEGLTGSDSVVVQVNDTFVVTLDPATGLYQAPAGSTVVVNATMNPTGADASSLLAIGENDVEIGGIGYVSLGSVTVYQDPIDGPSTGQFSFVMPSNGQAYVKAEFYYASGGPSIFGVMSFTLNNNGETLGGSVTNSNINYP